MQETDLNVLEPSKPLTELWRRDYVVVAVETVELAGAAWPLTVTQSFVINSQLDQSLILPLDWSHAEVAFQPPPTTAEWERAQAALRQRLARLRKREQGMPAAEALHLVDFTLTRAAEQNALVVVHAVQPGLAALLAALRRWRGTPGPVPAVVSTAVLERARRVGLTARPGERGVHFYRRAAALAGPLPPLPTSLGVPGTDGLIFPDDTLFPALAIHMSYQLLRRGPLGKRLRPG